MQLENTFLDHFSDLKDPRCKTHRNFRHSLFDILVICILATICGADTWVEIHHFGLTKDLNLYPIFPLHFQFWRYDLQNAGLIL